MKYRNVSNPHRSLFTADNVGKLLLEFVFVLIPMMAVSVVLYDVAVKGMGSIFTLVGLSLLAAFVAFRCVRWAMSALDEWSVKRRLGHINKTA